METVRVIHAVSFIMQKFEGDDYQKWMRQKYVKNAEEYYR